MPMTRMQRKMRRQRTLVDYSDLRREGSDEGAREGQRAPKVRRSDRRELASSTLHVFG
jgi:hypothetical protein